MATPMTLRPLVKNSLCAAAFFAASLLVSSESLAQDATQPGFTRIQGETQGAAPPPPSVRTMVRDFREDMRSFIQQISNYARSIDPNFSIIVRDPEELIIKRDVQDETMISPARTFMLSIDGVMFDGVFRGDRVLGKPPTPELQKETLERIQRAKQNGLPVFLLDFAAKPAEIDEVIRSADKLDAIVNVLPVPENLMTTLPTYPRRPHNENPRNVLSLHDVKNFTYIANPRAWGRQDQFAFAMHDSNYDLLIVDPFIGREPLSGQAVATLKYKKIGAQRLVFARADITSAMSHRYYWKSGWTEGYPSFIGAPFPGEPDRYFVDYWDPAWQQLIFGSPQSFIYGLIKQGYNGVLLEGMQTYLAFEGNVEIPQAFAPMVLSEEK